MFLFINALLTFSVGFITGLCFRNPTFLCFALFVFCVLLYMTASAFSNASPKMGAGIASWLIYYGLDSFYAALLSSMIFPGFLIGGKVKGFFLARWK